MPIFGVPFNRFTSGLIRVIGATALSIGLAAAAVSAVTDNSNHRVPGTEAFGCEEAEGCFRAALAEQKNVTRSALNGVEGQSKFDLQLDRLHLLMEKHPGSVWAKRAGLVTGVLLRERDPGRAVQFLRSARRDFPLLEDYLRLWMGQALLKLGDIAEAAALMESIREVAPDSPLATRAVFEAAEAWYRAGQCDRAVDLFATALRADEKESVAPVGWLHLADCHLQLSQPADAQAALRSLWVKLPQTPEAREAYARLTGSSANGQPWSPTAEDRYQRAKEFHAQAFHEEAVEEFRQFLSMTNRDPRIADAKYKLALSLVRLKRYEQAKFVFQDVIAGQTPEAGEATVWLARVYLRQSEGDQLLALSQTPPKAALTHEQRAMLNILRGVWLEDQGQMEQAIAAYRKVDSPEAGIHRVDGLWKMAWARYQAGQWKEAIAALQRLVDAKESEALVPQALYWMARASDRLKNHDGASLRAQLCARYPVTYYCQLVRQAGQAQADGLNRMDADAVLPGPEQLPPDKREEVTRDRAYRRAVELRLLGMGPDAARELAILTRRYGKDAAVVLALSRLLSEAGAHGQALRLARLHFREDLELRGNVPLPALWRVGYPTAFVPAQAAQGVDPDLVSAIIREESQYDGRAVSRVGALGLMQVMPATANTVAKKLGLAEVKRDDLFDEETNVRIGARYVAQLLEQFSGNVIYTVAAYNAGPQAVNGWIAKHGRREPDEFVELIPYQETRLYVKRVLRSYREYQRLRQGQAHGQGT
ncbi:Soluble lytic murein transglycosylase precursor [Nitrospira tepida]|uniref:Soluble lytic murein transglycosylase n=1 Tax=Nitrospira tepida TaxID=2973512 RepID=A0AA86N2P8_9BACT|nr:Soluble lytic murein transglycosylase precursor [Nitrospira tepida]